MSAHICASLHCLLTSTLRTSPFTLPVTACDCYCYHCPHFTIKKTEANRGLLVQDHREGKQQDSLILSLPPVILHGRHVVVVTVRVEESEWKGMAAGDNHWDSPQMFTPWAGLGSATLTEHRVLSQSFFPF